VTTLANKDKREYGHRCDQQNGEHDGPNQRRKRSRLFMMVCHRRYSLRQLFANAAIAASRVGSYVWRLGYQNGCHEISTARMRTAHHAVCSASASKNMTMLDALVYLILGLVGDGMEQQKVHYV